MNEFLQVEGYSNIYAIGDCADIKEPKMAYHAGLHANIAVANIVNSMKQRPLKAYKPGKERLGTLWLLKFGIRLTEGFGGCKVNDHKIAGTKSL